MEISKLNPLTYGMLINKSVKNNELLVLNLKNLVIGFKLDKLFISKSYFQTNPEFAYTEPQEQIPDGFQCLYCNQSGPRYHLSSCIRPFKELLVLSENANDIYPGFIPGSSYNDIVLKRGQKKVISTSIKSGRFTDNVNLIYQSLNGKQCIIRISKNGSINIISASFENDKLYEEIIKKINNINGAVLNPPFVINSLYTYVITGQFNIYPSELKDMYHIDLDFLNTILITEYKLKIQSQDAFMNNNSVYFISEYIYNSGNIKSKSDKFTNPYIQFVLVPKINNYLKMNVMIYKRGAVQIKISYNNLQIDTPITLQDLSDVYNFLKNILNEIILDNYIILPDGPVVKKGIQNMVDGKQPRVCQNRVGNFIRPDPYSFYGKCPIKGYYIRPSGTLRLDGTYEPCCYRLKKDGNDSEKNYREILKRGYSGSNDSESAVFIPGTKTIESRNFKGLLSMDRNFLMQCLEDFGYIIN